MHPPGDRSGTADWSRLRAGPSPGARAGASPARLPGRIRARRSWRGANRSRTGWSDLPRCRSRCAAPPLRATRARESSPSEACNRDTHPRRRAAPRWRARAARARARAPARRRAAGPRRSGSGRAPGRARSSSPSRCAPLVIGYSPPENRKPPEHPAEIRRSSRPRSRRSRRAPRRRAPSRRASRLSARPREIPRSASGGAAAGCTRARRAPPPPCRRRESGSRRGEPGGRTSRGGSGRLRTLISTPAALPRRPHPSRTARGYPTRSASVRARAAEPRSSAPGTSDTPRAAAVRRAADLSPRRAMLSEEGPMKAIPAARHSAANAAFSERNP